MNSSKRIAHRRTNRQRAAAWVIIPALALLGAAAAWYFLGMPGNPFNKTAAAASTPDYHTAAARLGDIEVSASGSGTLVAARSVDLSFPVKGTLAELRVKPGDAVKAGQALASLAGSPSLQAAATAARLQLLTDQKALSDLQSNAGVALAQAYQAQVKAQEAYNNALQSQQRTAYARCSEPVTTKYLAQVQLYQDKLDRMNPSDRGSDTWISLEGSYQTALANYTYCAGYTAAEKTDAGAALQVAQVNLSQAENAYNILKAASGIDPGALALAEARVTADQAQLDQAQSNLQGTTLVAPMDGVVTYVAAAQGALVDTSKFITIADLSQPQVKISLDETDLDKLAPGSQAQLTFDALPDQVFTGQVVSIDPQLTASSQVSLATGLVALDAASAKAIQGHPLGLNATVTVIEKQARNALLVPVSALRDLGGGQYAVFVVGSGGQLRLTPVTVGIQDASQAQILSGLRAGELVSTGLSQQAGGQ